MKPIIGISCSRGIEQTKKAGQRGRDYDYVKLEYHRLVEARGGIPILLPNVVYEDTLLEFLARIDGLMLTGGDDIDPSFYGQENRYEKSIINPERDRVELYLARMARKRRLPLLGICRGVQLMNVAFGGDLHQDVSLRPNTEPHSESDPHESRYHQIRIVEDSHLFRLVRKESWRVNSRHHQLLDRLAPGFGISAVALDGVTEAIERVDSEGWLLAVQWHPESMPEDPLSVALFDDFIAAART